jgi:hypothetical protein
MVDVAIWSPAIPALRSGSRPGIVLLLYIVRCQDFGLSVVDT